MAGCEEPALADGPAATVDVAVPVVDGRAALVEVVGVELPPDVSSSSIRSRKSFSRRPLDISSRYPERIGIVSVYHAVIFAAAWTIVPPPIAGST
jgi:hypothetical protein